MNSWIGIGILAYMTALGRADALRSAAKAQKAAQALDGEPSSLVHLARFTALVSSSTCAATVAAIGFTGAVVIYCIMQPPLPSVLSVDNIIAVIVILAIGQTLITQLRRIRARNVSGGEKARISGAPFLGRG